MEKIPKSSKSAFDVKADALRERHAQRSITLDGETIQKKVIFEALHAFQQVDEAIAIEACEYIALDTPLRTAAGKELIRQLGYRKGDIHYSAEVTKIVESSFLLKDMGFAFDPTAILKKLTNPEREMISSGKTNVEEYLERKAEMSANIARTKRKLKETEEALSDRPPPLPATFDNSAGKKVTPQLREEYENLGIKPDRMQRRLDDAVKGRPSKPLFYDREQPKSNDAIKKDDKGNRGGGGNNGPGAPSGP